jgi:hypothetical protein
MGFSDSEICIHVIEQDVALREPHDLKCPLRHNQLWRLSREISEFVFREREIEVRVHPLNNRRVPIAEAISECRTVGHCNPDRPACEA